MDDKTEDGLERKQESPLPLTDPRVADAQRMLNIPYHIVW